MAHAHGEWIAPGSGRSFAHLVAVKIFERIRLSRGVTPTMKGRRSPMRIHVIASVLLIGLLVGSSHADEPFEQGNMRFEATLNARVEQQLSDFLDAQLAELITQLERRVDNAIGQPAAPNPIVQTQCVSSPDRVLECTAVAHAIEMERLPAYR